MKQVKKQVETTVYEAVDGTQFNSADECKKYEQSAAGIIHARFSSLEKQEIDSEEITMGLTDYTAYIIRPRLQLDVTTISQYISFKSGISEQAIAMIQKAYEECKHLVILSSRNDDYIWIECILEDHIEKLKTFI